jgi:hypothetical protein
MGTVGNGAFTVPGSDADLGPSTSSSNPPNPSWDLPRSQPLRRMKAVRVVVAEAATADAPVLAPILEADGFEVVGRAASADGLRAVLAGTEPQVVVFDAGMSAPTVLSTRDWAPGAGIVVVWPADVLAAAADERVEPSRAAIELGDAVRRAVRVYHAPSGVLAAGVSGMVLAADREAASKMGLRRMLTFAMASLLIVLGIAAVALQRGDRPGVLARSPIPSPPGTGPTGPTGPGGTPGGNGSGQPVLPPVGGLISSAGAQGGVASARPTGPSGPPVPGGHVPGPGGPGPATASHRDRGNGRPDVSESSGTTCFNGYGDSGHHGDGDSGHHGDGDSGYHGNGDSGHHGNGNSRRGNCGHQGNGSSGPHAGGSSGSSGTENSSHRVNGNGGHRGNGNSAHHANGHSAGGH